MISLLLLVLPAAGCGKVGPPLPPEILIPRAVADLSSAQIGNEVRLSWTVPPLNTDGSKATTIQQFDLYRMMQPATESLPAAGDVMKQFKGTRIMTIDFANLDAFTDRGKVVFLDKFPGVDPATLSATRFWYALKVINRKKQDAGFSNIVIRQYLAVPPPIARIEFQAAQSEMTLSWDPPPPAGAEPLSIAGYNVYRSEQSKVRPWTPINAQPLSTTRFEDRDFQFGTTYYYTVRCVVRQGTIVAESFDSPEFSFKPIDIFPPKTPGNLTVVYADGRMNLLWDANLEPDFSGYNVYRGDDGTHFKKINETLLKSPTFRDEKIQHSRKYFYRVTAVDTTGNESPPSEPVEGMAEGS